MTTLTDIRDALTAALGAVEGLSVTTWEPATVGPLCAWPRFISRDYATPIHYAETWQVFVTLNGTDLGSALGQMESLIDVVADALNSVSLAAVIRTETQQLIVNDHPGGYPAMMYTVQIG